MVRKELEALSREELIARAEAAGIVRPRSLTTAELLDELVLRGDSRDDRTKARGWFGRARDLLKSALKSGLDLPETSSRVVKATSRSWPPAPPPPLPTVTLAEIYAAQGHLERALQVLGEVLAKDPEHAEATRLRAEYAARADRVVARPEESATSTPSGEPALGDGGGHEAAAPPAAEPPRAGVEAASEVAALDEEIDEIVAVAVDPSTVYLYWEVGAEAVARARVEAPEGALTVRTVSVAPGSDGPLAQVRDDRVDTLSGELFVRGLRGGAHVRVSVGWLGAGGFVPLAVGADLSTPRSTPTSEVANELATWSRPRAGAADAPATRAPRFVGRPAPSSEAGRDGGGGPLPRLATTGGAEGGSVPARRVALLRPTAVFDVAPGAPVPVGVWQPPGSSELSLIFGQAGAQGARGGASDLVLGGASDRLLARSTS